MKTFEDFLEKYTPIKNDIIEDSPFDGSMFETYGEELRFVQRKIEEKVWTILDNNYLIPGFHIVNRIGYIITKESWENEQEEYYLDNIITKENLENLLYEFIKNNKQISEENIEQFLNTI